MSNLASDDSVVTVRWEIVMPEHSEAIALPAVEQEATEAQTRLAKANERAATFLFGTQKLMFEEFVFASNEFVKRAQTEMHLFSELVSKMAGVHSVKDIRTMCEECSKHQLDFIRRDCDRVFKHGEWVIEATSSLFKDHPMN
jgi:hypothetical protein